MKYCRLVARLKGTTDVLVSRWYDMNKLDVKLLCKFYNGLLECKEVFEVNIEYSDNYELKGRYFNG